MTNKSGTDEARLDRIQMIHELGKQSPQQFHFIDYTDMDWLLTELRASWEREKVMREALEYYAGLRDIDGRNEFGCGCCSKIIINGKTHLGGAGSYEDGTRVQGYTAKEALSKIEEKKEGPDFMAAFCPHGKPADYACAGCYEEDARLEPDFMGENC